MPNAGINLPPTPASPLPPAPRDRDPAGLIQPLLPLTSAGPRKSRTDGLGRAHPHPRTAVPARPEPHRCPKSPPVAPRAGSAAAGARVPAGGLRVPPRGGSRRAHA